jgi:DNA-binding NarL/FixJ family response regulator
LTESLQVVVVEDHPSMRRGLELLLPGHGLRVIGSAASAAEGEPMIAARRPDVAIVDIDLGDSSGLTLARSVTASPATRVVLYTGHVDHAVLEAAVDSGASGVVLKSSPLEDLTRAVHAAASGGTFVDPAVSTILSKSPPARPTTLSSRETEVLCLLASGRTSAQVADHLVLSPDTVNAHVRNVCSKLGARGRLHAVVIALGRGEIELSELTKSAGEVASA